MLTWIAVYENGDRLAQFNEDGTENKYADIDRKRLVRFVLMRETQPVYAMNLHEGQRLIFRRRTFIDMLGTPKGRIYLVGYQFNDESGKNYKVVNYVYENGTVELDDDRNDLVVLPIED